MLGNTTKLLLFGASLFGASAAVASPLTFYYDFNSWHDAAIGLVIGLPSHGVRTDTKTTIQYTAPPTVVGTSTTTSLFTNGDSVSASFDYPDFTNPEAKATQTTDATLSFPSGTAGFESNDATFTDLTQSGNLRLNGQPLIPPPPVPQYHGFFGVLGDATTLDFNFTNSNGETLFSTAGPNSIGMAINDMSMVSRIPEPPSLMVFATAVFLLIASAFGIRAKPASRKT